VIHAYWLLVSGVPLFGGLIGVYVRLEVGLAVLRANRNEDKETLRRIEDAVWTQAGIAVLPARPRPQRERTNQ
jgi:hypothetical protein